MALSKIRQLSSAKLPIGDIRSDTLLSVHPLIDISRACVLVGHLVVPVGFQVLLCNSCIDFIRLCNYMQQTDRVNSLYFFLQLSFYDRSLRRDTL